MSITAITIENFKGIREPIRVEFKPITLLFGPNSAGKSTIVQALHYAREIFERQNLDPDKTLLGGDSIDLGGFESLVHQHDLSRSIVLRFDIDLEQEDLPNFETDQFFIMQDEPGHTGMTLSEVPSHIETTQVEVSVRWSELLSKPYAEWYKVYANNHYLLSIKSSSDEKNLSFDINQYNPIFLPENVTPAEAEEVMSQMTEVDVDEETQFKLGVLAWAYFELWQSFDPPSANAPGFSGGLNSVLPSENTRISLSLPGASFPEFEFEQDGEMVTAENETGFREFRQNLSLLFNGLIVGPCSSVRDGLKKLCYLGPLRDVPVRSHKPLSSPEASRWANGLAAYDILFFGDDAFVGKVNEWLSREDRLNSGYSVEVKKLWPEITVGFQETHVVKATLATVYVVIKYAFSKNRFNWVYFGEYSREIRQKGVVLCI